MSPDWFNRKMPLIYKLTFCSRNLKHCWLRTPTNSDSKSWSLYHAPPVTLRSGSILNSIYTFFLDACKRQPYPVGLKIIDKQFIDFYSSVLRSILCYSHSLQYYANNSQFSCPCFQDGGYISDTLFPEMFSSFWWRTGMLNKNSPRLTWQPWWASYSPNFWGFCWPEWAAGCSYIGCPWSRYLWEVISGKYEYWTYPF